jgi:mRNA interferase MazF
MATAEPRRGEVWLAHLDKVRPVVILTRDPMGSHLHSVIVGPITSTVRGLSTEVRVGPEDGVVVESVVNVDNTQLIERTSLLSQVGIIRAPGMKAICRALAVAVDCA